jgi:uncharacterized protein YuzE
VQLSRDIEADAAYVHLSGRPYAYGRDLDDRRRVDYASDGTPIGIELLQVSFGVDTRGLPTPQDVARLLAAHHIRVVG